MKKIYLVIASLLALGATTQPIFASTPNQQFTTIAEAQQYCPATNGLVFTPSNSSPNSAGTVTGNNSNNGLVFKSTQTVMAPQSMAAGNFINNANFNNLSGLYGYITNNVVTCIYSYPGFSGTQVNLIMRSVNSLTIP